MAFNVEFQDKEGNQIEFNHIDAEVCNLWNVPFDDENWASLQTGSATKTGISFLDVLYS